MAIKKENPKEKEISPKQSSSKDIVIKETEEDVVLGSGFTGDPDDFKNEIKKEAEKGSLIKKFLIPLFFFLILGVGIGFATWYYARPEKTVPKTEDKIQTPPSVPEDSSSDSETQNSPSEIVAPETPTSQKKETTYTVVEGDTLSSIANAHDMTSAELATYNGITDVNSLKIGQVIKIPVK